MFCWPWTFTVEGIYFGEVGQPCVPRQARQRPSTVVVPRVVVPHVIQQPSSPAQVSESTKPTKGTKSLDGVTPLKQPKPPKRDKTPRKAKFPKEEIPARHDKSPKKNKLTEKPSSPKENTPVKQDRNLTGDKHTKKVKDVTQTSNRQNGRAYPSAKTRKGSSRNSATELLHLSSSSTSSLSPSWSTLSTSSSLFSASSSSSTSSSSSSSSGIGKVTSESENASGSGFIGSEKVKSKASDCVTAKDSDLPKTVNVRNDLKALHSVKTPLRSCLAPAKKHVRFAPEVQGQIISDDDQTSSSSSPSSNTSNDSYIDPPEPVNLSDFPSGQSHVPALSRPYGTQTLGSRIPRQLENPHHPTVNGSGQHRTAKSSVKESPAGSSLPPKNQVIHQMAKSGKSFPNPIIIPWPDILDIYGENKQYATRLLPNRKGKNEMKSKNKGRKPALRDRTRTTAVDLKNLREERNHTTENIPRKGLTYDARTGLWFRDV